MLNNNLSLTLGGNSLSSFFSSVLYSDLVNRFLINSNSASSLVSNNGGVWRAVVTLSITLPFQNLLTKFKNKVHLLLYILIFETLTSQRPIIRPVMSKAASAKNKRERRKSQDGVRIESYNLNVSIYNSEHLQFLLYVFLYFIAPNTNKKKTAPSRFVPINLETTQQVIKFSLKGLGNLPFGFVADDLSALRTMLEIQIHPFSSSSINSITGRNQKVLIEHSNVLKFIAFGLGVVDVAVTAFASSDSIFNLRLKI